MKSSLCLQVITGLIIGLGSRVIFITENVEDKVLKLEGNPLKNRGFPVSYTHLTLPTKA